MPLPSSARWPALCTLLAACAAPPPSTPQSGYVPVAIDVAAHGVAPDAVRGATLAGLRTYGLQPLDDARLQLHSQGAAEAGPATLVLHTDDGDVTIADAVTFMPPLDPRFERVVAVGASLTQGVQGGVPTFHGGLMSPAAQAARQLGGWFPLPLLVDGLWPAITPADVGPPPECAVPEVAGFVAQAASDILPTLWDPEEEAFSYARARLDPTLSPHDLAVGGSNLADVLRGLPDDDFGRNFVASLVHDPYGTFGQPAAGVQIELAEALLPTLVLSFDLYGNDLIGGIVNADVLDPTAIPPVETFEADAGALLDRLAATGAEVFVGNIPRPTLLPATAERRARMLREGLATEPEVDAAVAAVEAAGVAYNAAFAALVDARPTVHLVDLADAVDALEATGLRVGDETLTVQKLGGLLGPDGVHFTDTGYAWVANLFLAAIAQQTGVEVPPIDLAAVLATDPASPAAMAAAGVDPAACAR